MLSEVQDRISYEPDSTLDKSSSKEEAFELPAQQQVMSRAPFVVSSSLFPAIPDHNESFLSLHPYYIPPFVAPANQFFLEQEMLINDADHSNLEKKLLNDVFFSPAAMLSPSNELGLSKVDDVSSFTEFGFSSYERTSSICSSSSTSEDEDYSVHGDNHSLFLCDLDFEPEDERDNKLASPGMKRSINEFINPNDNCTILAQKNPVSPKTSVKKRKTKENHGNMSKGRSRKSTESDNFSTEFSKAADRVPNRNSSFAYSPTLYEVFTKQNIDWCRYCGTTEGINWRPGPWGKRTLCNKHGCDYKGYGFACKLPRLDLTEYLKEPIIKRTRPVLQLYCSICQKKELTQDSKLFFCDGCPKSFHTSCLERELGSKDTPWYCTDTCCDNLKRRRVVVELPRKRLPLMRTPKSALLKADAL